MNAIVQTLLFRGFRVTGSDRYADQGIALDVLERLTRAGLQLFPQDGSGVTPDTTGVVVSTAIEADNADLLKARKLNIPVIHRAQMLADCIGTAPLAAIAGTCGKTSVTGMTGWLLEQCGKDPFTVNGGAVIGWDTPPDRTGNVRPSAAETPLWVIEADESDRSFLCFRPEYAILTNISQDHFSLDESIALFNDFASRVTRKIICTPSVAHLLSAIPQHKIRIADDSTIARDHEGWHFTIDGKIYRVPQPGRHNAENALLAFTLALELGCSPEALHEAMPRFPGIRRRLETCGTCCGVTLVDDYAHNPEKIRAAWTTLKEKHHALIGIWRPHGFGPLAAMRTPLTSVFKQLITPPDLLYILPVYYAGGTTQRALDADTFVHDLQAEGIPAHYAPDYEFLLKEIPQHWQSGGAVLCMGARDPELSRFPTRLITTQNEKPEKAQSKPRKLDF